MKNKTATTRLIIDTDMGNDVDDALALVTAFRMEHRSSCATAAILVNKPNLFGAKFTQLLTLLYADHPIPIGLSSSGPTPHDGKFIRPVSEHPDYAHLPLSNAFPEALNLFRKTLAESPDHSVAIASIGFANNLKALLESGPDKFSPLSGPDLIRRKVKKLAVMAGDFRSEILANPHPDFKEHNIYLDIDSMRHTLAHWPAEMEIHFLGFETGIAVTFPGHCMEENALSSATRTDPLARAYRLFGPMPHDRPCWDPLAVLYSIVGESTYFQLSGPGHMHIFDEGHHDFRSDPAGRIRYLRIRPEQIPALRTLFADLCVPPAPSAAPAPTITTFPLEKIPSDTVTIGN